MQRLKAKTALITGGNSGIGFATAKLFLSEGASVIITGCNEKLVNEAVRILGKGASGFVSDAGKMSDLDSLAQKVSAITSKVDILFANAGVAFFAPFAETSEEMFDSQMDINFKGSFFTVQKLLPLIPDGGSIILNSTILVHCGLETASLYSASKAGVLSLSKTLAAELAGKNIRVNSISPGPINTPIYGKLGMTADAVQEFSDFVQAKIPLQKFGSADDIANAALFLASSESSFMTGSEIRVDGGKSMAF